MQNTLRFHAREAKKHVKFTLRTIGDLVTGREELGSAGIAVAASAQADCRRLNWFFERQSKF